MFKGLIPVLAAVVALSAACGSSTDSVQSNGAVWSQSAFDSLTAINEGGGDVATSATPAEAEVDVIDYFCNSLLADPQRLLNDTPQGFSVDTWNIGILKNLLGANYNELVPHYERLYEAGQQAGETSCPDRLANFRSETGVDQLTQLVVDQ